jgi:hypothetical protein
MASEVDICNLALSHVGANSTISSLSEQSEEAFHCNLLYAELRDSTLRSHPWGFATKWLALSDLGSPPGNWTYQYSYPSDCLWARKVLQTNVALGAIPFEIGIATAGNSPVILTDQETATLVYTMQVTNTLAFDALFVQALGWRLAAELTMPLTRDFEKMQAALKMFQMMIGEARTIDANESTESVPRSIEADWISGRA